MANQTFSAEVTITIKASIDEVWDALTNPDIIKQYLHDTDTKTDWVVGQPITWSGIWNGKPYEDRGVVLAYKPKQLITTSHWSPLSGSEDKPENYHIVTYELSSSNNQTDLKLIQSNSPSQQDADSMIENGWKPILQSLKELVEKA